VVKLPKKLPDNIQTAVQMIRKEYGHYVEAKFMRGRYRLFEATSIYDPETKKPRKITRYLGWLTESGQLIPARHNDIKTKVLNEIDKNNEQKIKEFEESLKNKEKKLFEENVRKKETEKHERDMLRALSMNARITVPELSKITGLGNTTVNYHLRNLERRYDIKYLLEIDLEKFGYINYMAFVKFKDKKPSYEEIKQQLEAIPYVQIAMMTKGTYDMVIFLVVEATSDARGPLYDVTTLAFPSYNVEWNMSPAYFGGLGLIPLRDKFFDILKEKVWTRTKERPRPLPGEITEVEHSVLKAMNNNSNADFTEIDRQIKADKGRSNYAYHQLTKRGIIKRPTISLQHLRSKFDVILILSNINLNEFISTKEKLLLEILKENRLNTDTYTFSCDIMSPKGAVLITHVLEEENIDLVTEKLSDKIKGFKIDTLIVTKTIIGSTCDRLFDKTQTSQYDALISSYHYDPETILKIIKHAD